MKKLFTTFFSVALIAGLSFAQGNKVNNKPVSKIRSITKAEKRNSYTGFEQLNIQNPSVPAAQNRLADEIIVGQTYYDLQTNSSIPSRIVQHTDGRLSAVWTQSQEASGYTDRGSGYNTTEGGAWPAPVGGRLEASRTGFTSICVTDDGAEHVFTHSGGGVIQHTSRLTTNDSWVQGGIPHQTSPGGLWARSAASGNYLHMIYVTIPTGNGGAPVDGLDGKVLYNRSSDGGTTWDIVDLTLPGLDSTLWKSISAEDYAIDANGSHVAVLISVQLGDILLFTSDDNGTTWTTHKVFDFAYDRFTWGDYYDTLAVASWPASIDTNFTPNPNALFCTNGHADVSVAEDGTAHVFFAGMFLLDEDFSDASMSIFNGFDAGIRYWNTSMATITSENANDFIVAGYTPDLNGDNILGHPDQTEWYTEYRYDAMSAQPSSGITSDGQIYVTFNCPSEVDLNAVNGTLFRKVFYSTSSDSYQWWSTPAPVATADNTDDGLLPFQEHTYGAITKHINDATNIHVIAQVDYTQGTNLNQGNSDFCQIDYFKIASPASGTVSVNKNVGFEIVPNPAANATRVNLTLASAVKGSLLVMDMSGRVVKRTTAQTFNQGANSVDLDVASLTNGIYLVQLRTDNFISTQKLVVSK